MFVFRRTDLVQIKQVQINGTAEYLEKNDVISIDLWVERVRERKRKRDTRALLWWPLANLPITQKLTENLPRLMYRAHNSE